MVDQDYYELLGVPRGADEATIKTVTHRGSTVVLQAAQPGERDIVADSTTAIFCPCASVSTVTVGAVRSGNTSTGMRAAVQVPVASSRAVANRNDTA